MTRSNRFRRLAARGVRTLQPYVPGKPIEELERELGIRGAIKLASNENPLGPSALALQAAAAALPSIALYPDGSGHRLRHALAEKFGVEPACITLGNGSNDLLVLLAETFLSPRSEAVYSQYGFLIYDIAVRATGARPRVAPARGAASAQPLGHDLAAMAALVTPATRLIYIANPNNPTGTWLCAAELRNFLAALPDHVIVVLDEAYREYGGIEGYPETVSWLGEFPNLVITRTFSKIYGLAGLRVGYAISAAGIAELLNRVRQPFNVNSPALEAALAALGDDSHLQRSRELNAAGLIQLRQGLAALAVGVQPSAGNFVLADFGGHAAAVNAGLLRRGVIVRPVANYGLPAYLRITVGLREQNSRLLEAVADVMSHLPGDA